MDCPLGDEIMSPTQGTKCSARERVEDIDAILEAMRLAVRDALLQHKREGRPIVVWRDGRVEWIQPGDIPVKDA
jgi:hypothetical protein